MVKNLTKWRLITEESKKEDSSCQKSRQQENKEVVKIQGSLP